MDKPGDNLTDIRLIYQERLVNPSRGVVGRRGRVGGKCVLLLAVYPQFIHSLSSCLDMEFFGGVGALTRVPSVVGHLPRVPDIGRVRTCVRLPGRLLPCDVDHITLLSLSVDISRDRPYCSTCKS